eukprot:CAMPEP_0201620590 /NCGR_PEP_ID=MMETSP0492-20130828/44534_1 /ASSEMBLY_ACC=CAM_ASM_000837 /TAXON_ID=420259 /ORGANISM="Thalassiosira gravida, Strain GMp14c1" /LENGTH=36 /DNA_ID= /DNA_START= /DNA_END= /DNA_ORIENTATION=
MSFKPTLDHVEKGNAEFTPKTSASDPIFYCCILRFI